MPVVFLESERLWYRPFELDDVPLVTTWINDPRIRRFLDQRVFPLSMESEREFIKHITVSPGGGPPTDLALLFGPRGESMPIGSTGLHKINWVERNTEWGILIGDPANWNKGYGREAARRMLRYAFEELNLHRVQLRVNVSNPAGIKAYEAAGFVREGILRQAAFVDGEAQDALLMAALRPEWLASNARVTTIV